jgi:two-component system, OmpR family, sensor kinase
MRLHRRLTLAMAVLLVIGLAVADLVTYTSLRSFLYGRLDAQLDSTQRLAVRYLDFRYELGRPPTSNQLDERLSPDVYILVLSKTGQVIVTRPSGSPRNPEPQPNVPRSVRLSVAREPARGPFRPNPNDFILKATNGVKYRAQAARVPQGTVVSALALTQTDETLASLVRIELGVSAAVLVALCVLALWTVRRGLRPLDDMAETAGAIASGDLSRRIEVHDDSSEVGRLGSALNAMLSQIEAGFAEKSESEARLRQFVGDASHELRTPLTSIRGYAELLRKGAFPDEGDRLRALQRVEHEAARMGGLVDDLLLLARLDQGRPLERVSVDLRRVCRDAVDDAQLAHPDRAIELVAPAPVTVAGDKDRIAQVAHNLVRNAVVHTPPGVPVCVQVQRSEATGVLRVVDEGPGLTARRLERVFDRFYRGDVARTGAGTGLGLSIVRAIAEALGGRAWAEERPGGGTVFAVEIPLFEGASPSVAGPPTPGAAPPAGGHASGGALHLGEAASDPAVERGGRVTPSGRRLAPARAATGPLRATGTPPGTGSRAPGRA